MPPFTYPISPPSVYPSPTSPTPNSLSFLSKTINTISISKNDIQWPSSCVSEHMGYCLQPSLLFFSLFTAKWPLLKTYRILFQVCDDVLKIFPSHPS